MAMISEAGVETFSVQTYADELSSGLAQAVGDPNLDLQPETPQGQIITTIAAALNRVDQSLVEIFEGLSIFTATGSYLDALVGLFGVFRLQGQRSTATVMITAPEGTQIPQNTRLRSSEGDIFNVTETSTVSTGETSTDVEVISLEIGPVDVAMGVINELVGTIAGVTSVSNTSDGVRGRFTETDTELRNRFIRVRAFNTVGTLDAIQARVLETPGVVHAVVRDNPSATPLVIGTTTIPPYNVLAVVQGGEDSSVAQAILDTKPASTPTAGTTSQEVSSVFGLTETVRFTRVTDVPITVAVSLDTDSSFLSSTSESIISALVAFVGELSPGTALDQDRARAEILKFSGFDITTLAFAVKSGGANLPTTVDITNRLTLAAADVTITI